MDESLIVRRETQIAAPPATVFAFLTDPQKILSWMGMEASTEPQPGGLYLIKGVGRNAPRGRRGVSTVFSWPVLRDAAVAAPQDEVVRRGALSDPHGEEARSAVSNQRPECEPRALFPL